MKKEVEINKIGYKKRNSAILIFSIYAIQLMASVIIFSLSIITSNYYAILATFYYIFSFFCAIPQAGFSDFYGRKRHLIIASFSVILSGAYLLLLYIIKQTNNIDIPFNIGLLVFIPICFLLGVAGNAIPIARAGLADLEIHDFRTVLGWSTVSIGFGWISPIILKFMFKNLGVIILSLLILIIATVLIILYFQDYEDYTINIHSEQSVTKCIKKSYKWFISMFSVIGGSLGIFAYLFAETTFYQIYSFDVVAIENSSIKVVGIIMAFGYAFGVLMQWIIAKPDKKILKIGALLSLFMLICLVFFKYLFTSNILYSIYMRDKIEGVLTFLVASGYGFTIPALFSIMSKNIKPHHYGKLFGAIDSVDTFALGITFFTLFLINKIKYFKGSIFIISLIFFIIACILYYKFIKKFISYEKENLNKNKKKSKKKC